jgi:hypothetical protein
VDLRIAADGTQQTGGEWPVDAFEELEEDEAEAIARAEQPILPRPSQLFDQALRPELGDVVAQRRER